MLRVENLSRELGDFSVRDVSFTVGDGDYIVLLGLSGAGKTLVLEMLAGVTQCGAGHIWWDGEDITRAPIQSRRMGLVYQDQALFPHLTVRSNIAYPLNGASDKAAHVKKLAKQTGVGDLLHRYPATLSGGEMQRVALARALAVDPRCLLLDEPLSSLDAQAKTEIRTLLRKLHREGQPVVHVTHDYEEALSLATKVCIMEGGTIVQAGEPAEVFHHPKSEFVARFTGIRNVFKGRLSPAQNSVSRFDCGALAFSIAVDGRPGPAGGCAILRSEDVTLSRTPTDTSARNCFSGVVTDVAGARLGAEVTVDIGAEVVALVTPESVERLGVRRGQQLWVSFKATAVRFIEE